MGSMPFDRDQPTRRGKVRDVFDLGDRLLLVATDRISAYDWVLPTTIPDKGRVLTALSAFWFARLGVEHHLISTDVDAAGLDLDDRRIGLTLMGVSWSRGSVEVDPVRVRRPWLPVGERLAGVSAKLGTVCGDGRCHAGWSSRAGSTRRSLPRRPRPRRGTTINVSAVRPWRNELGDRTDLHLLAAIGACGSTRPRPDHAASRGLILADTKFEFGRDAGDGPGPPDRRGVDARQLTLLAAGPSIEPGGAQPSFDKQFVRDWLDASGWDKASPPAERCPLTWSPPPGPQIHPSVRDPHRSNRSPGPDLPCSAT